MSALHSTGWPDGVSSAEPVIDGVTMGLLAWPSKMAVLARPGAFSANKVFVISNGIDTSRFEFSALARQFWRAKLRIASDAPVVGS
jgi:hypothetical protein